MLIDSLTTCLKSTEKVSLLISELLKLYFIQGVDMSMMFGYAWGGAQRCR